MKHNNGILTFKFYLLELKVNGIDFKHETFNRKFRSIVVFKCGIYESFKVTIDIIRYFLSNPNKIGIIYLYIYTIYLFYMVYMFVYKVFIYLNC